MELEGIMKYIKLILVFLFVLLVLQGCTGNRPVKPSENINPVIQQRLQSATITQQKLKNGANFTHVKFKGSLAPNHTLGCVGINKVTNQYNPPSLMLAARKCIQQGYYSKAWELMTTANGFAYYDIKQLADRSASGARTVLTMRVFSNLAKEERLKVQKSMRKIQSDPVQVKSYCMSLKKIGPPSYEPMWAILHGIGAYKEPRDGHYLTNVDKEALWQEVLRNRCTPLKKK